MKIKLNYISFLFLITLFSTATFGQAQLLTAQTLSQPLVEECKAPAIHNLADTLQIGGDFDGVPENTRLVIDGQLVYPVWETRSYARFVLSNITPGAQAYELSDQRVHYKDCLHLIRIKIDMPKMKKLSIRKDFVE